MPNELRDFLSYDELEELNLHAKEQRILRWSISVVLTGRPNFSART
jgi:hypothetical protein